MMHATWRTVKFRATEKTMAQLQELGHRQVKQESEQPAPTYVQCVEPYGNGR